MLDRNGPADDNCLVYDLLEAGSMLGLNRNASYAAAKRGDIPTIKIGKLIKVPKAAFHQMLEQPVKQGG
ncbi:helix-turn-helix domain-containing protein [Bradyrhizobium sp. Ash2021]|uniref:helix-turn-helix domain-containing protein n=1 Tax=Bradyrhizobium sp. Ash2021 TaxID=2954771 RepID=UPI002815D5DD|nr:helix-turn-helix domain-containing protein [Bradyrhizobium sp. Ash2021]WMT78852.1 helix-turn-helix domain-containing protein [Bradyrhizobium sp. Ash2021]